jgi:hypothetical protein
MRLRGGSVLARAAVAAATLALGLTQAAAGTTAPLVLPIAGLTGAQLHVAGVARLSDGGAVVAASVDPSRRASGWHPAVVRLLLDGSVDLAYGTLGIAAPSVGAGQSASAVAINPGSGQAWIGLSGPGGRGAVLSLTPGGSRAPSFGHAGLVPLGSGQRPLALAWQQRMLLVAAGTGPCAGCSLIALNPATGARLATGTLVPAATPPGAGCPHGEVSSVVTLGSGVAQLAFTGGRGCPGQLDTVVVSRARGTITTAATDPIAPAPAPVLEAQYGSARCVALARAHTTALGPDVTPPTPFVTSSAPGAPPLALVALGQGACAALIAGGHGHGGVVVQAAAGHGRPVSDRIPSAIAPLGMFRCHAHLLVIGSRSQGHTLSGEVAVFPVRRGPFAQAGVASAASARCS